MSDLTVTRSNLPAASHPDRLYLGMMEPDADDVADLVSATQEAVKARAAGGTHHEAVQLYGRFYPLTLPQYVAYARDLRALERELRSNGRLVSVKDSAPLRGLIELRARPEFTPDFPGYVAYLKARNPALARRIDSLAKASALPEEGRREHTLIVAPVNWGKSELLKALAYHYAEHDDLAAVVVLDPGGDMAKQIARWPELVRDERVILIEPGLREGKTVGLNPLDGAGLDEDERSIVATFWAQQIGAITTEVSPAMERLARHCVHVLLAFPSGATFRDLILLLGARDKGELKPRQRELLEFAKGYKNSRIGDFFRDDFQSSFFEPTRHALKGRIDWILSLPYAEAMFCGQANFRLADEIERRKFIVVNLAKFGQAGGAAIGKLLVAMLGAIARKRNTLPIESRTPTHVFIDEVSTMVSGELLKNLKELRKFGLYTTLAQQVEGDGFSKDYKQILTRLTACKFVGSPSGDDGGLLYTDEALPPLNHREFWVQWPGASGVGRLQVRSELADYRHAVSDDEWLDYEARMIAAHYVDAVEVAVDAPAREYVEDLGISLTADEEEMPGLDPYEKPEQPPALVPKPTTARRRPPKR